MSQDKDAPPTIRELVYALTPIECSALYFALNDLTPDDPSEAMGDEISYEGSLFRIILEERINEEENLDSTHSV